ncbi:MAG: hypothetical protein ACW97G_01855 [Candidatus Thorarchaeota archaeon]|jgi:hypothetical protein
MKPDEEVKKIECPKDGHVVTLGVEESIYFEFHRHGSVGEIMEFEIKDESVLTHLRTETEYIHPEKMKYHDWTGGDAEKGKWFFKTIGTGTTSLVVSKIFRGTLESKCTVQIVVE